MGQAWERTDRWGDSQGVAQCRLRTSITGSALLLFSLSVASAPLWPQDSSPQPPGPVVLQARMLEGLPFPSPGDLFLPRVRSLPCSGRRILHHRATGKADFQSDSVGGAVTSTRQGHIPVCALAFQAQPQRGSCSPRPSLPPPPCAGAGPTGGTPRGVGSGSLERREASLGWRRASSTKTLFSWYAGVDTGPQGASR